MGLARWILPLAFAALGVLVPFYANSRGRALLALRDAYNAQPLPHAHAEALQALTGVAGKEWNVSFGLIDARRGFPVVISPATTQQPAPETNGQGAAAPPTREALYLFVESNHGLLQKILFQFGAILFRGFPIDAPQHFERLASLLEPHLDDKYLGTSPRLLVPNTTHVFSASEFPGFVVIPVHCEMSFTHLPPPTIIFHALRAPDAGAGGETPLADFAAVWDDLPAHVHAFFASNELVNVRSYFSDDRLNLNPLQTKSWQQMFQTSDKAAALVAAASLDFNASFNARDSILIENVSPATRKHPHTGRTVWHNHLGVFHPTSIGAEYAITAARIGSLSAALLSVLTDLFVLANTLLHGRESIGQYTMLGNRSEVPAAVMDVVRATTWKHTVVYPYHSSDVVFIDNHRVAHGRQPYAGPRTVHVTWGGVPPHDEQE